jgi:phosphate:Na+ symporter
VSWEHAGALLGGLGLFLLGMTLLTDGLKVAAGDSLRDLLGRWTKTRSRALTTGFAFTALLQSSSAVTVAVIGFVNAGMLSLLNAVWVVFGANVGTTMTAWIVSLVGLKLKIGLMALPMIGIGMALRLTGAGTRWGAYGVSLAGFGLFFLGISILSDTFSDFADQISLIGSAYPGFLENAAFVGAGFMITVLTQSSSASMAVALTAAAGGLIPLEPAAALVIGANLGTTSTALFAAIGATPAAKRVAVAHLIFNVLTGVVALLSLPLFLGAVFWISDTATLPDEPAVLLALFHTIFNVAGVLLVIPVARGLVTWLSKRFVTKDEDDARLHYLDDTTAAIPALAANAIALELARMSKIASAMIARTADEAVTGQFVLRRADIVTAVADGISRYLGGLYARKLPEDLSHSLVHAARSLQHYAEVAEIARDLGHRPARETPLPQALGDDLRVFLRHVTIAATACAYGKEDGTETVAKVKDHYDELKEKLLKANGAREIDVRTLDVVLRRMWSLRRAVVQLLKGQRRLDRLRRDVEHHATGDGKTGDGKTGAVETYDLSNRNEPPSSAVA